VPINTTQDNGSPHAHSFENLMDTVGALVVQGLHTGHFEFTVQIQPQSKDKTRVIVKAGPSKQFVISNSDIPR